MGIKIIDMTEATSLLDSDKFAVSSNDAPRKATAATVTDHVIGKVEAIAAGSSVGAGDGVYLLQGGNLKPVDVDLVTQRAIDIIWDKADEVNPSSGKLALKDGATEKTVTLANLASFVQSAIEAGVLDISSLSDSVALSTTDNLLVTQGSGARKTTLSAINTAIYEGLAAHVAARSAITEANDTDAIYVLRSGEGRKLTLEKLKEYIGVGDAIAGPSVTEVDRIPQWSGVDGKELKEGLPILTEIRPDGATDGSLATETAIRAAIDAAESGTSDIELGETSETAYRGDRGKVAYDHSQTSHAPLNAQKNSHITKEEIEAKLTGTIESHSHVTPVDLNNRGVFDSDTELIAAEPTGQLGWYAYVLSTSSMWIWDTGTTAWVDSTSAPAMSLGETDVTAYRGDRGKIAYDHSQDPHAPPDAQERLAGINLQEATSYSLTLDDAGKLVRMSHANAITVTVPVHTSVDFEIGAVITIEQVLAGVVTLIGESGVNFLGEVKTDGEHTVVQLIQVAQDQWLVLGGVA